MKNTLTLDQDLKLRIYRCWDEISPDAGYCTPAEKAELVLDRLPAKSMELARTLIDQHGYVKVRNAVAKVLGN